MKIKLAAAVTAFSLFAAASASATVWTSQSAFDAANPGLTKDTFNFSSSLAVPSYTVVGGNVSGSNLTEVFPGEDGAQISNLTANQYGGLLNIAFTAPQNAVGFLLSGSYAGSSGPITVTAYDGATSVFQDTPTVGTFDAFSFYGLSGLGPITSVVVSTTDPQFPAVGEIDLATAAGVPEPSIWAILLVGFGGLGAAMRTRRRGLAVAAA